MNRLVCVAFVLSCLSLSACQSGEPESLKHSVSFNHKGNKSAEPIQASLFENKNAQGKTEFYMDVNSVFCGENVCKLDLVRIVWNELGVYQRFELAKNVRLEKGNAEDFTEQDYKKLAGILANPASGLANLYPAELVNQNRGGNVVDALSGATVSIHNNDTVKGAIWTCYTLWHYAHGELQQVIRDVAGRHYSLAKLTEMLRQTDVPYAIFALEQLAQQSYFHGETRRLITDSDLVIPSTLYPAIINYIEALPQEHYKTSVIALLEQKNSELAMFVLESLHKINPDSSAQLSMALTRSLVTSDSYPLTHSILGILSSYSVLAEEVLVILTTILEDKNFIKARGVYWMLNDYPLPEKEQEDLQQFYQKYSLRL